MICFKTFFVQFSILDHFLCVCVCIKHNYAFMRLCIHPLLLHSVKSRLTWTLFEMSESLDHVFIVLLIGDVGTGKSRQVLLIIV